jgi:hypothetical protein
MSKRKYEQTLEEKLGLNIFEPDELAYIMTLFGGYRIGRYTIVDCNINLGVGRWKFNTTIIHQGIPIAYRLSVTCKKKQTTMPTWLQIKIIPHAIILSDDVLNESVVVSNNAPFMRTEGYMFNTSSNIPSHGKLYEVSFPLDQSNKIMFDLTIEMKHLELKPYLCTCDFRLFIANILEYKRIAANDIWFHFK